jgi:Zn-dependent metalloprotease
MLSGLLIVLTGCLNGDTDTPTTKNQDKQEAIYYSSLRDTNPNQGMLTGKVTLKGTPHNADSLTVSWADQHQNPIGTPWVEENKDGQFHITEFIDTAIPEGATALLAYPTKNQIKSDTERVILFHDYIGNTQATGPGGNERQQWTYGAETGTNRRPHLAIHRETPQSSQCTFNNGLVSVIDMNNETDSHWEANKSSGNPNPIDDMSFPAYSFYCDTLTNNPIPNHTERPIVDEVGIWTYSTLNDAMYYGTHVYETFLNYLGEPPLKEKIRLRVHYGKKMDYNAYWDGNYANFQDGYLSHYSLATLDVIAHEVGHGVLSRISSLNPFNTELSTDALTLHEAFSDISGVMAKHELNKALNTNNNIWTHGEESDGWVRQLDQIETENGAISSFENYDDAGNNYYYRIGMITYPFYLLSQTWSLEQTYEVYIHAARNCWHPNIDLPAAAQCIADSSLVFGLNKQDVVNTFGAVGIEF